MLGRVLMGLNKERDGEPAHRRARIGPLVPRHNEERSSPTTRPAPNFDVAELETVDGQSWVSIYLTNDDAERKLVDIANDWGIEADLYIAQGIKRWGVSCLPCTPSGSDVTERQEGSARSSDTCQ